MSPKLLGFIRGLCFALLTSALTWIGDVSHLQTFLNPATASLVSAIVLAIEHGIEAKGGGALFGAARSFR